MSNLMETAFDLEGLLAWRARVDQAVRAQWVGLIGRVELSPGTHLIGSDPAATVFLPAERAPASVGSLVVEGSAITLHPALQAELLVNDEPLTAPRLLRSDAEGTPDVVTFGSITMFVIVRGPRTLVRVRDSASPALAAFGGREWFAAAPVWRIAGQFVAYDPPKTLAITNILGDTEPSECPGAVEFTFAGASYRLDAQAAGDGGFVLHFCDQTNGRATYGAGRFLYVEPPVEGHVALDFNRATSPPCAFTPYATCPLPPQQNRLPFAVEAGERDPTLG